MFVWTVRLLIFKFSPKYELPTSMPQLVPDSNENQSRGGGGGSERRSFRSMDDVTCFKVIRN